VVGLVLVSHSKALAIAVRDLALQMASADLCIGIAAGVGEDYAELGTDAVHIADVLRELCRPDGAIVLMDMGSAVLSAQTALEFLEPAEQKLVLLSAAPFVEGAVVAAVQASAGCSLKDVAREVELALVPKREQVGAEQSAPVSATTAAEEAAAEASEIVLTVQNEHGLHARPAASLVETAAKFRCTIEVTNLSSGAGPASARSLTSVALLQIRKGDRIKVRASGEGRDAALRAISEQASSGFGEALQSTHEPDTEPPTPAPVGGVPAATGIAIGPLLFVSASPESALGDAIDSPEAACRDLRAAIESVKARLEPDATASKQFAEIRHAQAIGLGDPVLLDRSEALIRRERVSAGVAWARICDEIAASYQAMDDGYLRERAADIRDLKQMVLHALSGTEASNDFAPGTPSILFTDELLPSEAALCDRTRVLGVIARHGSPTSHSAIILRAAGIPMVLGIEWLDRNSEGKLAALNGSTGEVWIAPDETVLQQLRQLQQERASRQQRVFSSKAEPVVTADGVPIDIMANVSSKDDAVAAASNFAAGVGLLRTELLFGSQRSLPESEQLRLLTEVLAPSTGPVLVRTLDVGGDKPLPSLPCEPEGNPFLGVRGIRLTLRNLPFFRIHLRSILRAGVDHDLWIMFPMVSAVREITQARDLLSEAHKELVAENTPHAWPVKLGCMIEVPSAALTTEKFARDLDFFSIGTNDLTQYTMAAERGNAALSELQDAAHPAVLQLIDHVVRGARPRGRHVSVCGEAAADPITSALFLGLGIRSLSVTSRMIPETKAWVRSLRISEVAPASAHALQCVDANEVRSFVMQSVAIGKMGSATV
jgi:multiphosphoryl transfer protein